MSAPQAFVIDCVNQTTKTSSSLADILPLNVVSIRFCRLSDTPTSHKVNRAELKQSLEYLVKPCALLRFERKQRRERQEAAAAAAQRAESWKEEFMRKMEALDKSKASHFLEVVSAELRSRRWKISDIFRDVDRAKSGALGEFVLLSYFRAQAASRGTYLTGGAREVRRRCVFARYRSRKQVVELHLGQFRRIHRLKR